MCQAVQCESASLLNTTEELRVALSYLISCNLPRWRSDVFEDLNHGRLDLALIGDEGHVPSPLLTEVIYEEELVCIVAAEAPYRRQLTLKQYLSAEHIGVDVGEGSQHIPEKRLASHGHRRLT